jgi:hypothetical protein
LDAVASLWLESWQSTELAVAATDPVSFFRDWLGREINHRWSIYVETADSGLVGFLARYKNRIEQLFIAPKMQITR